MNSNPTITEVDYRTVRERRGSCLQAARSLAQADIYELQWEGLSAVMKDFSARPWLVRRLWSRPVAAREVRMLRRLPAIKGFPCLYAIAGPEAFVMERIEGTRIPRKRRGGAPPVEFWDRTRRLVEQLHDHGIAHGDLRLKNMLIGPEGEPYLIDFATAMGRRAGMRGGWLAGFLFERCRRVDQCSFARIKAIYEPDRLDDDERRWLEEIPLYLRIGRLFKKRVLRLKKRRYWRKRWIRPVRRFWQRLRRKAGPKPRP